MSGDEGTDLTDRHNPTATLSNGDIPNNSETMSLNQNGGDEVGYESGMNKLSSSYANKLSPESLTKANLRKLEVNVPNGADYDVWLHVASVHEFASIEGVDYVLRNGPWMIRRIPIFLNKWSPFVSLLKEESSLVPVWVKFHDVPLVAFSSGGLSMMATKIGTPMMLPCVWNHGGGVAMQES
ncbi:primary amine oxidase-like protein [Tanacetum coccineum]